MHFLYHKNTTTIYIIIQLILINSTTITIMLMRTKFNVSIDVWSEMSNNKKKSRASRKYLLGVDKSDQSML